MKILFSLITTALISTLIVAIAQQPGEIKRGGQNLYHTQEAHDAVQDQRLSDLEEWRKAAVPLMQEVRDNQNLQTGGIIGFGAVLTFLQILQLRKMNSK